MNDKEKREEFLETLREHLEENSAEYASMGRVDVPTDEDNTFNE